MSLLMRRKSQDSHHVPDETFHNDKHHFYKDYENWDMYNSLQSITAIKHELPRIAKVSRAVKDKDKREA
jgi:hypothetical protein